MPFQSHASQPRWLTFTGVMLMLALTNLDITIVNLATPAIAQAFHTGFVGMQWVISGTAMACAMTLIIMGRASDIYGNRLIFLVGTMLFILGSLLAALSPTLIILIFSRGIQGVGIAATLNTMFLITVDLFPKNKRGQAIGYVAAIAGLAQAIGPPLGGLILEYASWHWMFLINIPLGITAFFIIRNYRPKETTPADQAIHYIGAVLLAIAIFLLVLTLNHAGEWGLKSILFWACLLLTILAFVTFAYLDRRHPQPLMNHEMLRSPILLNLLMIRALIFFIFFAFLFIVPIYLQNTLGFSPVQTGQILLSMTGTFGIVSYFGGRLTDIFGTKNLLISASIFYMVAFTLVALSFHSQSLVPMLFGFALYGVSLGLGLPSSATAILAEIPSESAGVGIATNLTVSLLGGAVGVAITGVLFEATSRYVFTHRLPPYETLFASQHSNELLLILSGAHPISELKNTVAPHTHAILFALIQHSLSAAFATVIYTLLGISVTIFISCLGIKSSHKS